MKLNPDCIRDVLLVIEDQTDFNSGVEFNSECMYGLEEHYSYDEVKYHLRQCNLAGFFVKASFDIIDGYSVTDLTPKGHEFIANIRKSSVWNGVKSIAGKVGSTSMSALIQISSNVIAELIKAQFGII